MRIRTIRCGENKMRDRFYELGNAIGKGKALKYIGEDIRETGRDLKGIAQGTCNTLYPILAKASYPITGNLSLRVRERIEEGLGERVFNSKHAGAVSAITNFAVYPITFNYMNNFTSWVVPIAVYAIAEGLGRVQEKSEWISTGRSFSDGEGYHVHKFDYSVPMKGSLIGKLVSLPFDTAIGIYDGIKQRSGRR